MVGFVLGRTILNPIKIVFIIWDQFYLILEHFVLSVYDLTLY